MGVPWNLWKSDSTEKVQLMGVTLTFELNKQLQDPMGLSRSIWPLMADSQI